MWLKLRLAKCIGLSVLSLGVFTGSAWGQAGKFPDQPIKMIVPFAPGGGVDTAARLVARQMQGRLGVSVVVENRAGANGTIGSKLVQGAPADGYTLLFSAATHVISHLVMSKVPYDPITDFAPVARVGEAPLLLVVSPNLPQKKLTEVLDAARQHPDKWTAALPAMGAPSHLATLLLAQKSNLKLTMAPYKGTSPALVDVAGGHAQILLDSIISLMPMAKTGKVHPVVTTSARRSAIAPEIATASESGLPGFVFVSWYGLWAPKDTPHERIQLLNTAANEAVTELIKSGAFAAVGIDGVNESVAQFGKYIANDVAQSADLLRGAGFKPE